MPLAAFVPAHEPVALHDVAFVADHVIVDALPICTVAGFAAIVTTGAGGGGGGAGGSSPPLRQPDIAASTPSVQVIAWRFTICIGIPTPVDVRSSPDYARIREIASDRPATRLFSTRVRVFLQ